MGRESRTPCALRLHGSFDLFPPTHAQHHIIVVIIVVAIIIVDQSVDNKQQQGGHHNEWIAEAMMDARMNEMLDESQ